jgi:hypothetical protein
MTRFLSKENFEHVFNVSKQYLADSHGISVHDSELQRVVAMEMKRIGANSGVGIDVSNKRAIVAVRNLYLPQKKEVIDNERIMERKEESNVNEDDFAQKLKEFEVQRNMTTMSFPEIMKTANTVEAADESVVNTATAPPTIAPTTIIVQQNPSELQRTARVIRMNSADRLWMYEAQRCSFIYSGDMGDTIISTIIPNVATIPFYIMCIEGAGCDREEIMLMPYEVNGPWMYLKPVGDGIVRTFGGPWTITINDSLGDKVIAFGHDGWIIEQCLRPQIGGGTTVCKLANPAVMGTIDLRKEFDVGNELVVYYPDKDERVRTKVMFTRFGDIEVADTVYENGVILNLTRQVTVFATKK